MIGVSVVTPSYNQGRFIGRTIESVLAQQTFGTLEYVVVDGASQDETVDVLRGYEGRLMWVSEPDRGQADAVNKGIQLTRGEVIGWLNSDDTYRPGALVTVSAYFARHPGVDVVYADANLIDEGERIIGRYYTEQWNARRLLHRPFICQPAAFFRRRVVDRFGLLDATLHYSMDYEYWLRLARGGASFAYFPFTVASSRVHALTKTVTAGTDIHDELNVMLKRYVRCIPDEWILTQTHAVLRTRKFSNPASFALAVAQESLRLSLRLNGGVSRRLALRTLRTLSAGAVKTGLRAPLTRPLQ